MTGHLLAYKLDRPTEYFDMPAMRAIVDDGWHESPLVSVDPWCGAEYAVSDETVAGTVTERHPH